MLNTEFVKQHQILQDQNFFGFRLGFRRTEISGLRPSDSQFQHVYIFFQWRCQLGNPEKPQLISKRRFARPIV